MRNRQTARRRATGLVAVGGLLALTACGGSGGSGDAAAADGDRPLVVWTAEAQEPRIAVQRQIAEAFTDKTGIEVDLVAVEEGQAPQLIQSAALSGELPDVISLLNLSFVRQLVGEDLVDTGANARVVEALGEETFAEAALALTRDGGVQVGVPSDAWSQILVYRTDLFEAAGLEPPTTYEALETAAAALTEPGMFGITLATDASDIFTAQTFETLALGNGCQVVEDGEPALASAACTTTWELYETLARDYSPAGTQSVDSTRATYFAGQAAMVLWSTFLLDELAGLRNDAIPTCPECVDDPGFLAANSGVITSVAGPDTDAPGSYGEVQNFAVLDGADTDAAQQYIEFVLTEGYEDWMEQAPEGKIPVRLGTPEDPTRFSDAWNGLQMGVDSKAAMADVYGQDVVDAIAAAPTTLDRWAITSGDGALLGPLGTQMPIPKAIADLAAGALDAAGAARQADEAVAGIAASLS
ncbi:ABC transporter substrate-binding protein [Cellulosimicrobium cellulans]|uniref:ABC transporter substrate-binding protein n=1 Tax=Cellulosimicrobium cellulans TaxID=1710 RepID=UPI001652A508|nr:extracellular solute-binding protein [Cellulosimicrobium cellulans]